MSTGRRTELGARLGAVVDEILATDMQAWGGAAVADLMDDLEVHRRRLEAADVHVLSAAERCRRDGDYAAATLPDLLCTRLRIDPREATRRARRVEELGVRRSMLGEPLPPILPTAASALAEGAISGGHADVVIKYAYRIDALPDLPPDGTAVAEALLVDAARHEPPRVVAQIGEVLLARLDPDGREPVDARLQRERSFTLVPHPDGSATPRGQWTPELTAACQALLDTLAAPVPDADGGADVRSATQRRHDALLDAFGRILRGNLAPAGGTPLTVLIRASADSLPANSPQPPATRWAGAPTGARIGADDERVRASVADRISPALSAPAPDVHCALDGIGRTAHGALISLASLGCALCEAEVDTAVVNSVGGVLAFGRSRRLASKAQRLALAARDGGCTFPGCTRPAAWCEAHHVIPWWRDGLTDLANLCLVCSYHHRHFGRLGWAVTMTDGVPEWIPPPWIDPTRTPRRNAAHHLPDYDFAEWRTRHDG